jgi:flagellar assembly factor FliW
MFIGGFVVTQDDNDTIEIQNSQLGELSIKNKSIIHFKYGILGYESLKRFAIINVKECEPFLWLVAVDEPEISLPIIKYVLIYPDYKLVLTSKDRKDLELAPSDLYYSFFVVTVNEQRGTVTANLKGPIVINLEKHLGLQIIVTNDEYIIDYPIIQKSS